MTADALASPEDLGRQGRDLRRLVPRSSLGTGEAPDRDPVALLDAQNVTRLPGLVGVRWGRMAASAFSFFRGSAALMAHDLAQTPTSGIRVQVCGDAHLSNFGFFASREQTLIFDLNDFDETLPGPWEWDVERLAASLVIAARDRGFGDTVGERAALVAAAAYRRAMAVLAGRGALENFHTMATAEALQVFAARSSGGKELARATRKAGQRTSRTALRKLSTTREDGRLRLVEQPPLMVRPETWPDDIGEVLTRYRSSVSADIEALLGRFRPLDVVLRVVGVGSVGTRCLIVLLVDSSASPLILQVKEATGSVLEPYAGAGTHWHAGERVVTGQRIMQAASDPFLGWTTAGGRDYYVRQFRDRKGGFEVERLTTDTLVQYARLCGAVLARAHSQTCEPALLAGYLGSGEVFDRAMASFAVGYADRNEADYALLLAALREGRVVADPG